MIHPAHTVSFDTLLEGMQNAVANKYVSEKVSGDLRLYCYTESTVYDRLWTMWTQAARGLILDVAQRKIIATPFAKFFNFNERADPLPDLPFDVYDKMDGSLAIIFHHGGEWRAATKGSFVSVQAKMIKAMLDRRDLSALVPGVTYLAELVGPENKIVIRYHSDDLVLLAAYNDNGEELERPELEDFASRAGWAIVPSRTFNSFADMVEHCATLPADQEGFVARFTNGYRLKVKGAEYRRIHSLISKLSPLSVWEAMSANDNMDEMRRQLPEEFWSDFDQIHRILGLSLADMLNKIAALGSRTKDLSDKELGLSLDSYPEPERSFVFAWRKSGGKVLESNIKTRMSIFRAIRPTGNRLEGYMASHSLNRVIEEAA